jgi:hypothetical protein
MSTNESEKVDCIDSRTKRALDEYMTVLPEFGRADGADGLFIIVGENGDTYLVDTRTTSCECDDDKYNLEDEEACKHVRRCRIATGDLAVPARAIGDGDHQVTVDDNFGFRVDASAKIVAADGGVIDGETGEILEDEPDSEDVAESIWSDPKAEIDRYGKPTGDHYVTCEECGVEVLTALTDCASHREKCSR